MYLIDTNVLSDARRTATPAARWMRNTAQDAVFVSVITLGEIQKGIALKAKHDPAGAQPLLSWLDAIRREHADRILPISDEVALAWGRLEALRPRGPDGLIGATAIVHNLTIVTRNAADFWDVGVSVLDPWAAA
jgi:predicted nucleic acid-binding protein